MYKKIFCILTSGFCILKMIIFAKILTVMKKLLLISIISIAFLSSCGNSDDNKKASKQDATNSESTIEASLVKALDYDNFIKNVWNIEENATEFVFRSKRPCVIDFYATWCGPCKRVAPIIEKLAEEYKGKVDFYKVDIDQNKKLATVLNIKNIPTVFFMKAGMKPIRTVGAYDEEHYREVIKNMLSE